MELSTTIIIITLAIILIWVIIEIKRLKHKLFAIFLILLIIFFYFSFVMLFKGKDINFKSVDGIKTASKIYMNWLGTVFKNIKSITGYAINMDWKYQGNETIQNKS